MSREIEAILLSLGVQLAPVSPAGAGVPEAAGGVALGANRRCLAGQWRGGGGLAAHAPAGNGGCRARLDASASRARNRRASRSASAASSFAERPSTMNVLAGKVKEIRNQVCNVFIFVEIAPAVAPIRSNSAHFQPAVLRPKNPLDVRSEFATKAVRPNKLSQDNLSPIIIGHQFHINSTT